mgnify:FL=1
MRHQAGLYQFKKITAQPAPITGAGIYNDSVGGTTVESQTITLSGGFQNLTAVGGTRVTAIRVNGTLGGTTVTGVNDGDQISWQMTSPTGEGASLTSRVTVGTTQSAVFTTTHFSGNPDGYS